MRRVKILAIQIVVALVVLEGLFRFHNPLPFRVHGDAIMLPVGQHYRFDNSGTRKLDPVTMHTKNSLGFRGPEPSADFASRVTVLTIGGSTTECLYLSDGKTWSDVLARRLETVVPGVWVNNAGLDGHSTFGHLILLRAFVTTMRPTVAVFLVGANDIGRDGLNSYDANAIPANAVLTRLRNFLVERSEIASAMDNLRRAARASQAGFGHSEVQLETHDRLAMDAQVVEETLAQFPKYLPGYAARLAEIATIARANGIEPVWLTQPALFGDVTDPATGIALGEIQVNGRGNGRLEWRLLEMYNDVLRKVAGEQGVLLIDLARELPKDSRFFYDFLHFTNEGAERAGEIVAAELGPHLQGRTPARPGH